MACILKAPTASSRGVVVFTTPERDMLIKEDRTLQETIWALKDTWVIGLHHNWHDYKFVYNPLFDFSMAGEDDLREVNGTVFPLIPLDACNFAPECFRPSGGEKFWDILYVARAVLFKRIPEFFQSIRSLYDRGHQCRVLFVCPLPPYDRKEKGTVLYNIREVYDGMFSEEEKDRFTLLTLDYRYPFPFDLPTLAHFYRSSRIFVHSADEEKRCRVAAYAWASGIPVVGMSCVGSMLPQHLRTTPFFYEAAAYSEFPEKMVSALSEHQHGTIDFEKVREHCSVAHTKSALVTHLDRLFGRNGQWFDAADLACHNLDTRLGRHHGIGSGPNTISTPLPELVQALLNQQGLVHDVLKQRDPERELERLWPKKPKALFFDRIFGHGS